MASHLFLIAGLEFRLELAEAPDFLAQVEDECAEVAEAAALQEVAVGHDVERAVGAVDAATDGHREVGVQLALAVVVAQFLLEDLLQVQVGKVHLVRSPQFAKRKKKIHSVPGAGLA